MPFSIRNLLNTSFTEMMLLDQQFQAQNQPHAHWMPRSGDMTKIFEELGAGSLFDYDNLY